MQQQLSNEYVQLPRIEEPAARQILETTSITKLRPYEYKYFLEEN